MKTRNFALAATLALALPLGAAAQEGESPRERRRPSEEQRAEMRERIQDRFIDMAAERLELDASQRTRLASVLDQNAEQRRAIAEGGMRLRREAAELLDDDSPDRSDAERILNELTRLRERELELWRVEQDALADVLTPTQRLQLMAMQARFADRVRDMRHERGPAGRGAPGAPRGERPPRRAPGGPLGEGAAPLR